MKLSLHRPHFIVVLLQFYSVFSDCFGLPRQTEYFLILIGKSRNYDEPAVRESIFNDMQWSSFRGPRHCFKK